MFDIAKDDPVPAILRTLHLTIRLRRYTYGFAGSTTSRRLHGCRAGELPADDDRIMCVAAETQCRAALNVPPAEQAACSGSQEPLVQPAPIHVAEQLDTIAITLAGVPLTCCTMALICSRRSDVNARSSF